MLPAGPCRATVMRAAYAPDRTMARCAARSFRPTTCTRRLQLPSDAAPEAIEIAWRALLKVHHPDVAGDASLEIAKRINIAHDWLADPDLRARYDRSRGGRRAAAAGRIPVAPGTPPAPDPVVRPA